jgi:membrane protein implicated in regulation of membrane protease activity
MMWFWFGLAVLTLIGEVLTGTFYLLLVAVGLAAAGIATLAGGTLPVQLVMLALITGLGLALLRRLGVLKSREVNASRNRDVNLDIGETIHVAHWNKQSEGRVSYRGAQWTVRPAPGEAAVVGPCRIVEIQGSTLLVAPLGAASSAPDTQR